MNYTAASAAAPDDNVFYDSGREGRKIAHYSTFRTRIFSYATQRPQRRLVEQILLCFFHVFGSKTFQWLLRQLSRVEKLQYKNVLLIQSFKHKLVQWLLVL